MTTEDELFAALGASLERRETQYLVFEEYEMPGTKTRRWTVRSKSSGDLLGRILWHGAWRQFTFQPQSHTIFNIGCLLDINAFMTDAYSDWRFNKERKNKPVDSSTSG